MNSGHLGRRRQIVAREGVDMSRAGRSGRGHVGRSSSIVSWQSQWLAVASFATFHVGVIAHRRARQLLDDALASTVISAGSSPSLAMGAAPRGDDDLLHLGRAFVDAQRADLAVKLLDLDAAWRRRRRRRICTARSITRCAASVAYILAIAASRVTRAAP